MNARSRLGPGSTASRAIWFVILYIAGIAAVGVVAYGLRLWLRA